MIDNKYPKRGCMSDDGKFYTHKDGSVHERLHYNGCGFCSLRGDCRDENINHPSVICRENSMWKRIEGAYVPSDEEQEACEMARRMIRECCTWMWGTVEADDCSTCLKFTDRSCPARTYLFEHGDEKSWEATP